MAGFAKFLPIPPNSIFTTTIATKQPTIAIQKGNVDGRLNANSMPVTIALQSEIVLGCFGHNVIQIFKKMIQEATQTQISISARRQTSKVAAIAVGISATTTVSIMLEVVTGSFRCGEVTTKVYFQCDSPLTFFSQHLLAHSVVKHQVTVSRTYISTAAAFDAQVHF